MSSVLDSFSPATRGWLESAFASPTPAQVGAWEAIAAGRHTLVVAPTGSGKTLAAFLWAIDRLATEPQPSERNRRCRVVYVSPLKALAVDVERNLRAPLVGIRHVSARLGLPEPRVEVAIRSGDTPSDERRRLRRAPPDILITTPESLFLILTSAARDWLQGVETVIIDEIHAVAGTKRGAHLALTLERLDARLPRPAQRVGLSATVRPVPEVARFLSATGEVTVVQPHVDKTVDLEVVVPVEDMSQLGTPTGDLDGPAAGAERLLSIWPHVEERIADAIEASRSTIVFANSRRLAERLTARLNEIATERALGPEVLPAGPAVPAQMMAQAGSSKGSPPDSSWVEIARAHHGSVSKSQRREIEEALKDGRLPAVVATSSLELGIDMGAVDLVVQVESPPSVASGLQRVGRAGHQVGAVSRGMIFPKYRGDLVQSAVVAERMAQGAIEELHVPRNPLDVLAQQIVAMTAVDQWHVGDLAALVRRAANFADLPQSALESVLDMLSGRYPSDEFAELRPRLVWDRVADRLTGRPGAQRLAVTSGGTIPDRGLFGVFLVGGSSSGGRGGARVGELDEVMVYESRVGDVFTLGSSSWRIEDITADKVLVSPAPGQPGRLPFWQGDAPGRPLELGRAIGSFLRELGSCDRDTALPRLKAAGLDDWAAANLLDYLREQRDATGAIPDDRTIVVERFRDELGDWRVAILSPFGARISAPWALAVAARMRERFGVDVQAMHSDDGIVLRLPDIEEEPPTELTIPSSEEIEDLVTAEVGGAALFAARFRECAARALLLPRRNPGRRTPLWQQRQRSAQLLSVASNYGSFPILLETMRECLQDVFDVPGLKQVLAEIERRRIRIVDVQTPVPSPFARSLLFGYVARFLYEGDSPLAERRAQALTLDTALLAELLGGNALSEVLDADVIRSTLGELQRLTPARKARDVEGVADLLRLLGPLTTDETRERACAPEAAEAHLNALVESRRAIRVRIAGRDRWAAVEDAGRLQDALGIPLPVGVAQAFLEPVADPLGDLVSRYARTHGPFTSGDAADHFGLGVAVVRSALRRLAAQKRVVTGHFIDIAGSTAGAATVDSPAATASIPAHSGEQWCDAEVLALIRRRSLAALRKEVEPVAPEALARFLPEWQHLTSPLRGAEGVLRVVEQLAGYPVPASALEPLILASRISDYQPRLLDELTSAGEVLWVGQGALPGNDGWVALHLPETASLLLAPSDPQVGEAQLHQAVRDVLSSGGGWFFRALSDAVASTDDRALVAALWDLVWAGEVTNDTLAPLRALTGSRSARVRSAVPASPARSQRFARYGRAGRPAFPSRTGPPVAAGRWSLLPRREQDATRRVTALAEVLLERHGVLTRGAVNAEGPAGGFSSVYPVLSAFEDAGRARRGYFVERLGAAQFALVGAVDRLRAVANSGESVPSPALPVAAWAGGPVPAGVGEGGRLPSARRTSGREETQTFVLAAADPANPYGAALEWPERPEGSGHRPGRKAGALVVLHAGSLVLYVEKGGRSLLTWGDDPQTLRAAAVALAEAARRGGLGRITVERADGEAVSQTALSVALTEAGFVLTPRGLRLRG